MKLVVLPYKVKIHVMNFTATLYDNKAAEYFFKSHSVNVVTL